jgi:hypothetical protein
MKDYYDVWMLTSSVALDEQRLSQAIEATFKQRATTVPVSVPDGLSDAFSADPAKQRLWIAFARNLSGPVPDIGQVVADLRLRLMSVLLPR